MALTAVKLWLTAAQTIYAIGPAFHDDRLFVELAAHVLQGEWLGPYNQFTLAKGPLFPLFIAALFKLGVPLLLAQQALYAAAAAAVTRSLRPWIGPGAWSFALYAILLWNPMSYDAGNLGRLMRQNLYAPLALFAVAGLVAWYARRREPVRRQAVPALLGGLALGGFWLTREESVWLLPTVGLLLAGLGLAMRRELAAHGRALAAGLACFFGAALVPTLIISTLNLRHYGWFGTVEFRAGEFKDAYGALTRIKVGPELPQVPVSREMRLAAYEVSPAFARLQPFLEGPVGDHWSDKERFPAAEREIRGGWFVWAIRDAVVAAGLAPDAGATLGYYRQIADEVNAACDSGRLSARPPRSGFAPPLTSDLLRPLLAGTIEYTKYFVTFDGFTAFAPDSVGDYAELKPFRDFVGTHLSHAPRSLDPKPPERARRDAWKVGGLHSIGTGVAHWFAWLGPLVLVVGLVRLVESVGDRRFSFLLGLAGALLAGCLAYLGINILVHVTSFGNMSPAALAAAYPLYLAALVVIAAEATAAWRQPASARVPAAAGHAASPRGVALAAAGTALLVFGARLAVIHFYASDVPYNDQWVIEAEQILAPWINGSLGLGDFFIPHFEHLPVWTRLLAWTQVALTGRWDPLVQMTTNAALHAVFIYLVARWVWRNFRPVAASAVTLLLLAGGCLPHAWENIAWGFQSQFPLALIFLCVHVTGTCTQPAGSRGWWLAQAAAVAALFTLASMWLAPLAVVASWLWTGPRQRRNLLVPGLIGAAGALLLLVVHRTGQHTFAQVGKTPADLLHSALHLLGWPSPLSGAVALVQLPWLVHALRLRGRADALALDRVIFVLGLWGALQAVAIAFGRTGDNIDFVSRYGDLLFVSTLAGALALCRMVPAGGRERTVFLATAILWAGVVGAGLVRDSTAGHALYFHLHAAERRETGRAAVQNYLRSGDRTLLDSSAGKSVFLEDTPLVARLLDLPGLQALLPASVNPASAPDAVGTGVRQLQSHWMWLMLAGGLLLGAGAGAHAWLNHGAASQVQLIPAADPWRWRIGAAIGLLALGLTIAWTNPLLFDAAQRWQRCLGSDDAIKDVRFYFAGATDFGPERLQGAAPVLPVLLRNQLYGTAPAGPELTNVVLSTPFVLTKPWLVVPYSGYPVASGNGLRVRIVDAQNQPVGDEIGCNGPNTDSVLFWTIDTHALIGKRAQLVLYDGRTADQGWVAVAPPIPTSDPALAQDLTRRLGEEQRAPVRIAVAVIAGVALLSALLGWLAQRRAVAPG